MVGSAIVRELQNKGFHNVVTKTSKELDLRNQEAVRSFYEFGSVLDQTRSNHVNE